MVKRIFIIILLGSAVGLAAFFIQLKRGKIILEKPAEPSVEEVKKTEELTEEDILQGRIVYEVARISAGETVTMNKVALLRPGFVVVFQDEQLKPESVLGVSDFIPAGERDNVEIKLNRKIINGEVIYVGLHADNGNEVFDGPKIDIPINTRGSIPVRKKYIVGK